MTGEQLKPKRTPLLCGVGVAALLVITGSAHANTGTALMRSPILHLMFGNFFIGLIEGAMLFCFMRKNWRSAIIAVVVMIVANYVSAFFGYIKLYSHARELGVPFMADPQYHVESSSLVVDLSNVNHMLPLLGVTAIALAFAITLIVEWPFVLGLLWRTPNRWTRSVAACLLIHAITYTPIAWWYNAVSMNTLDEIAVVKPSEITGPATGWVYYLDYHDGHIHRVSLDGSKKQLYRELDVSLARTRLAVAPNQDGAYDLVLFKDHVAKPVLTTITKNFAPIAAAHPGDIRDGQFQPRNYLAYGTSAVIPPCDLQVTTGPWSLYGLFVDGDKPENRVRYAVETPFVSWFACDATALPDRRIVFQWGPQIVIAHPDDRAVALLAHGTGPVVGLETIGTEEDQPTTTPAD